MYEREYLPVQYARSVEYVFTDPSPVAYQMYARYSTMTMMRQSRALFSRKAPMKAIATAPNNTMVATTRTGLNICMRDGRRDGQKKKGSRERRGHVRNSLKTGVEKATVCGVY